MTTQTHYVRTRVGARVWLVGPTTAARAETIAQGARGYVNLHGVEHYHEVTVLDMSESRPVGKSDETLREILDEVNAMHARRVARVNPPTP